MITIFEADMQSLIIKKKVFHLTIDIEMKHCNEIEESADARTSAKESIIQDNTGGTDIKN